ncbi:type II DNA topoisomerase VI subunit A [Methanocella paludicola SANAE]|uniref:Type 2 DNA topoisomerase 6 subunit A n=1 Tax=Methanocella paludicola (strain DSM 17711 / JCM 13418 / NBRC 101707 / SANAE) TaxID=304371 RepID=D1YXQ9_METPS|nr:DNA topoisomerase IV subunit A [Methanocella paludicola]BAI61231.1 type II DNA topoisomerase VI subunit A [Methanocella paludicola SANAE]
MTARSKEIVEKLTQVGEDVLGDIKAGKNPSIDITMRSLSNVYYDEKSGLIKLGDDKQKRYYFNLGQAKKFLQTMLIAKQIKILLEQDKPALSIRQLFYTLKHEIPGAGENTFDLQEESDPIIEDMELVTNSLREELNLIATPNGVLSGPMVVEDKTGDVLDFTKMGSAGGAVPPIVEDDFFHIKEMSADYILVVEKYAVWNLLNQEKYWKKNNCLLLTGKGQPARAERRLLARFGEEYKIPIYVFTDMDPWGYYIYSVYKSGSINLAFFSEKAACPRAKYIGLSVKDVREFDIPRSSWVKLNDEDFKRMEEIASYDWFKKDKWQKELADLKKFGYKIEQDALVSKSIEFTANNYLPAKIENKDYFD